MTDFITTLGIGVDSRQVRNAERDLDRFIRTAGGAGGAAGALTSAVAGVGVAVGAAAVAVTGLSIATAQQVKETDAMAAAIGLSASELQQWERAAKSAGIAAGGIGDILKDATEKIGEFALTAGGEGKDVFENLSVSAERLKNLSPDKQLLEIAQALEELDTRGEKIFILESLGNDASKLLPLLDNNAKELKRLQAQALETGVALSDIDNQKLLALADATAEASDRMQGLGNRISAAVAPSITVLINELNDANGAASKLVGFFERFDISLRNITGDLTEQEKLNAAYAELLSITTKISKQEGFVKAFKDVGRDARLAEKILAGYNDELEETENLILKLEGTIDSARIADGFAKSIAPITEVSALTEAYESSVMQLVRTTGDQLEQQQGVIKLTDAYQTKLVRLNKIQRENNEGQKASKKLLAEAQRAIYAGRTEQERFNDQVERYGTLLSRGLLTQDEYNRAVIAGAESVVDFNTAQADELARLNDTTSALDAQQKSAENLAAQYDRLGQSIVSAVRAGDFAKLATMGDASLSSGVGSALKKGVSGASVSDIATAFSSGLGTGTAGATAAFNSFATGQVGQAIGLSTATTGAQMASQYGLTTGVAAGGTTLTSAGSFVQGGIANAGAGAAGSLVAGALGLGSGNAVQDTVLGTGGQFIGAALGGPIGAAIGSFLGTAISGLFGGKPSDKTQSFGLDLATGGQYATEQFTGDKFSQQTRDIADAAGAVAGTFVAALASETGKEIEGQLAFIAGERDGLRIQLDGVITDTTNSADEFLNLAQIAVADAFEINTEFYQGLQKDGEQLGDAYIRTNAQLDIAQMAAEKLGLQFAGTGEQGLTLADGLTTAFGGLVSLTTGLEAYYQTVFSAEERQDAALKEASDRADEVAKSLGLVGVSAVDTRKELRELVEAQDLTTESGAEAAAALVGLTGTIAALEDAAKAADAAYAETNTFLLANFGTELEQQAFALQLASGSIADYNAELGLSGDAYIDSRDELTDYIESLRGTGEAGRRAISELGPLAQAILDLEQAAGSVSSSNQTVSTSAGDVSVNLIDVGAIQSQLTDLRNRLSELPDLVKTAGGSVSSFNALLSATGDESYADKAAEAQLEFEKLSEELDDLPTSISQLSSELNDAKTANADAIAAAKEKKEADNAAAEAARGAASATRDLTDIVALQIRLLQTQGDEEGALALIRERELAATNDAGDAILLQIYAAEDLARASEKAAEAQQLLVDAVGGAFDTLSRAVSAEQDALRQQFDIDSESARSRITAARNALSGAQRLADQVENTIDGLRFDSIEADTIARRGAQSDLRDILRTGILPDDFSQQLSVLSEPSDKLFSTSLEFQRDFFRTQNNLQTLSDLTGEQLTEEERTLRAAEAQLVELELGFQNEQERLDGILEAAQAQIDAINGVNTSVLSVAEAIEELNRVSVTSGNITKTTSGSGVSTKTDFGDGVIRVDDSRNRTGIDAQYDVIPSGPAAITSAPVVQSDDSSNKQMVQAVQEQNKLLARVVANTNVLYDSDGGSVLRVETIQQ